MAFEPSVFIAVIARVILAEAIRNSKRENQCCRKSPNQFVPIDRLTVFKKARDVRLRDLSKPIPIARENLFP